MRRNYHIPRNTPMNYLTIKYFSVVIFALLLSGCIVQSTESFYTQDTLIKTPDSLMGEWVYQKGRTSNKTQNIKNWTLGKSTLITYDNNGVKGVLKIKFFKVNGILYCSSSPKSPDKKQHNKYWVAHVNPMYMLSRVTISDKQLQFTIISFSRLKSIIYDNKLLLAFAKTSSGRIYTAKSNEWVKFLGIYGTDPELFGKKAQTITLKRK